MGQKTNLTGAAEALGVNPETVRRWILAGAPSLSRPGKAGSGYKLDLGALVDWRIDREKEKALGAVGSIDLEEARRRRAAAEAGLAEHDLAIKQKQAVAIEDAVKALDAVIGSCRARLLGLGAKIGPEAAIESDASKCKELIDDAVRDAIRELSEFDISEHISGIDGSEAADPAEPQPVGATAKANGQRVGRPRKKTQPRKQRRARAVQNKQG